MELIGRVIGEIMKLGGKTEPLVVKDLELW